MRNLEEWSEESLFTQLFKCCTSPKKTTSVWRECLSHVQPRDQKSSLHWAASPTSADASSPCLLLTCPESWSGWWPWRAWNKAHLWRSTSEAELPWPDGPLWQWASMLKEESSDRLPLPHHEPMNQTTYVFIVTEYQRSHMNCSWKYGADTESMMLWLLTLLQSGRTQLAPNRNFDRSTRDAQEEPKTKPFY